MALLVIVAACSSPRREACTHLLSLATQARARTMEAASKLGLETTHVNVTAAELDIELGQCIDTISDEQARCILATDDPMFAGACMQ